MASVGLVLGAGGVLGAAYQVGAITALAEGPGWDARWADLIVGTSAGSSTTATLRLGFSPADHYARSQGDALSEEGRPLGDLGDEIRTMPPRPARNPFTSITSITSMVP